METIDIEQSGFELKITESVRKTLKGISTICYVLATCGFLVLGSGVVLLLFMISDFSQHNGLEDEEILGLGLYMLGMIIILLITLFSLQYARNLRKSFRNDSSHLLEKSIVGLRNTMLIFTLLFLVGTGLLMLLAFVFITFVMRW